LPTDPGFPTGGFTEQPISVGRAKGERGKNRQAGALLSQGSCGSEGGAMARERLSEGRASGIPEACAPGAARRPASACLGRRHGLPLPGGLSLGREDVGGHLGRRGPERRRPGRRRRGRARPERVGGRGPGRASAEPRRVEHGPGTFLVRARRRPLSRRSISIEQE
jgi:hypothetical protein